MFSSLTNFLPASLQPSSSPRDFSAPSNPQSYETDEDDDGKSVISEAGVAAIGSDGKKKKSKGPHETFIVVRPPPSKSNHPLNLQVQLVPPHGSRSQTVAPATGDPPSRRASIDSTASGNLGGELSRSNSFSSTYTGPSESTTSISSTSTSASSLGSRRAIVPLYNLQAHNVLTNVVADAGTDAKIAKFQKRGVEVIDLGVLDCVEVWPSGKDKDKERNRKSADTATTPKPPFTAPSTTHPHPELTPGSSAVSLSSAGGHSHLGHSVAPEINITKAAEPTLSTIPGTPNENSQPPPSPSKRNIFGKLFSRKEKDGNSIKGSTPSPPSTSSSNNNSSTAVFPHKGSNDSLPSSARLSHSRPGSGEAGGGNVWKRHSRNLSFGLTTPGSPRRAATGHQRPASFIESGTTSEFGTFLKSDDGDNKRNISPHSSLRSSIDAHAPPPTSPPSTAATTIQEVLRPAVLGFQPSSSGLVSPKSRAQLYVFTMRKWIKGNDTSLIGSLLSGVGSGFKDGAGGEEGDDSRGNGNKGTVELRFEWRKSLKGKKKRKAKRPGTAGSQKADDHNTNEGEGGDGGEESDPEDSETPWVCTLKVKRAVGVTNGLSPTTSRLSAHDTGVGMGKPQRRMSAMSDYGSEEAPKEKESRTIRLKVATLSPTPHHPKVVGMLKVPFPLADFDFSPTLPGGVVMRKRIPGQTPEPLVGNTGEGLPKGITLTAEEIKDVVSVSGLWLVVRESFGGLTKERRKGDGWKLRG